MLSSPPPTSRRSRSLLALLLLIPAPSLAVVAAMILWPGPVGSTTFLVLKAWIFLFPAVWFLLVEKQKHSLSPLMPGAGRRHLAVGAAIGLAISAGIVAAYALFAHDWIDVEHMRAEAVKNGIGTPLRFMFAALGWITINSILEEYVYRWFIFRQAESFLPPIGAALLSAVAFTVHHVIALKVQFGWNITIVASLGVFAGGLIWSMMYARTRSIWPGWVSHAIVDVAVFGIGAWVLFR